MVWITIGFLIFLMVMVIVATSYIRCTICNNDDEIEPLM